MRRRYELLHDGETYEASGVGEESAVEAFAERYWSDDCACPEGDILVREVGTEAWSTFRVSAETVVVFTVREAGSVRGG